MTTVEAATRVDGRRHGSKGHRSRTGARTRLGGGILWIVLVGALLAGVVAINVAVLQLNVQLDRLGTERAQIKADNARLRARLSSAGSSLRVAAEARQKLGLRQADPLLTEYLRLTPGDS